MFTTMRAAPLLCSALLLAGCASAPGSTTDKDRLEGFNRSMYKFNDTIDRAALKPVAKGYRKVTPSFVQAGVGNVLSNLEYPSTALNQFLQGKWGLGFRDTGRFLLNTTLGVGGLFDVATPVGLEKNDEDFGQTLAVWGVPSGPFLYLPLFGPSTLRDSSSLAVGWVTNPLEYTDAPWEAEWGLRGLGIVHGRSQLLPLDDTLQRTYDPYAFIRDAWLQQRKYNVFDGNLPPETLDEEFMEEGEDAEAAPPAQ